MSNVLCLDLSLIKSGWSVLDDRSNVVSYGTIPRFGVFSDLEWLIHISKCIQVILNHFCVDKVVLEDVYYIKNIKTYKTLCMLQGIMLSTCYEYVGDNVFVLPTSFVRSCFDLKSKEDVFNFVVSKFNFNGFIFKDHNDICDSIILGLAFLNKHTLFKTTKMIKLEKSLGVELDKYLLNEYWTNEKNLNSIAKKLKISYSTLHEWFLNLKIPIRTRLFHAEKFPNELTYEQHQVLLGTLFGDGGLYKSNKDGKGNYCLQITHSLSQRSYLEYKAAYFEAYFNSLYDMMHDDGSYRSVFRTIYHPVFTSFVDSFYNDYKKIIVKETLDKLDSLGIAIWYMDDGNYYNKKQETISIATHGFTEEENQLIANWFRSRFSIDFRITKSKTANKTHYYLRSGKKSEISKFMALVSPHIINVMRYKIRDC